MKIAGLEKTTGQGKPSRTDGFSPSRVFFKPYYLIRHFPLSHFQHSMAQQNLIVNSTNQTHC